MLTVQYNKENIFCKWKTNMLTICYKESGPLKSGSPDVMQFCWKWASGNYCENNYPMLNIAMSNKLLMIINSWVKNPLSKSMKLQQTT